MDAFYASVEVRDDPKLKNRPVIVGGSPQSRAVVCSASYEARKWGVRSAMSCSQAYRLCPDAVFIPPHFEKYSKASDEIHEIFRSVTTLIEPLSLDEAYLDVTENLLNEPSATKIARHIQDEIFRKTKLTASAGVAPNKFVAKVASDIKKPNGITVVPPEKVLEFLKDLPIEKMWGVGPVTAEKLHQMGIHKIGEIRALKPEALESELGKFGSFLYNLAFGRDDREVIASWEPKSRGSETTFDRDTCDIELLETRIQELCLELEENLRELGRPARTLTLKVKYSDFDQITRSRTFPYPFEDSKTMSRVAFKLLNNETEAGSRPIRLIGVSVSQFLNPDEPLQLWLKGIEPFSVY